MAAARLDMFPGQFFCHLTTNAPEYQMLHHLGSAATDFHQLLARAAIAYLEKEHHRVNIDVA
jgi:hypothetical protein